MGLLKVTQEVCVVDRLGSEGRVVLESILAKLTLFVIVRGVDPLSGSSIASYWFYSQEIYLKVSVAQIR